MKCPHCDTELRQHGENEGASKAGAYHCDGCGCCFSDGKKPREGTPVCALADMAAEDAAEAAGASEDASGGEASSAPSRSRTTSRTG